MPPLLARVSRRCRAFTRAAGSATVQKLDFQAGGPVGVRAVPTELRCRTFLGSPPGAVAACWASGGSSTAGESSGALTGGSPSVVWRSAARDRMPGANDWPGRSSAGGCWPLAPSCATSASGAATGGPASTPGVEGRAKGPTAKMAAKHAASNRCSMSHRCARGPIVTSVLSRAAERVMVPSNHGLRHSRRQDASPEAPAGSPYGLRSSARRVFGAPCTCKPNAAQAIVDLSFPLDFFGKLLNTIHIGQISSLDGRSRVPYDCGRTRTRNRSAPQHHSGSQWHLASGEAPREVRCDRKSKGRAAFSARRQGCSSWLCPP